MIFSIASKLISCNSSAPERKLLPIIIFSEKLKLTNFKEGDLTPNKKLVPISSNA